MGAAPAARRVPNPNVAAIIPPPERNLDSGGSNSATQVGTMNGITAVPKKPKALQLQGFRITGAGFEPATFGL
jgi:hypothetical protein